MEKKKIAIIDDDENFLKLTKVVLEKKAMKGRPFQAARKR